VAFLRRYMHVIMLAILSLAVFVVVSRSLENHARRADEYIYEKTVLSFTEWLKQPEPFRRDVLDRCWNIGGEHPSVVKITSGITWMACHGRMGDLKSLRLATAINFSLLIMLVYMFARQFMGRAVSLVSGIMLLCIPAVTEFAHFAEININLSLFWVLAVLFFLKGLRGRKAWVCLSGVMAGFSLGAKVTSLIIPISIFIWLLLFSRKRLAELFIPFLITGSVAFLLSWPSLWPDPVTGLIDHARYHMDAVAAARGRIWHLAFSSFFSNVPIGMTVLFILGIIKTFADKNSSGFLCLIIIFLLLGIFSAAGIDSDGIRYFLPAIPFFCAICATGLEFIVKPVIKTNVIYV